ncbi:hypothetical protein [Streptomyces sp. SID11385]|uniref:hypothetical protein n=1 Tax=Streptomyces sp. SID11385 TaxID=2706031 RepID=UPI001EF3966A|nr:hypothetical protein [Streptomyces sp. SID11385]
MGDGEDGIGLSEAEERAIALSPAEEAAIAVTATEGRGIAVTPTEGRGIALTEAEEKAVFSGTGSTATYEIDAPGEHGILPEGPQLRAPSRLPDHHAPDAPSLPGPPDLPGPHPEPRSSNAGGKG